MIDIRQGDCLELLKTLPDKSVDMVLTDPPYGVLDFKWDNEIDNEKLWQELKRVIKPNCIIALFGIEPFSTQVRLSNIKNYKYDWYWKKSAVGGFINAKKRPLKTLENIMVFSDGVPRYYPQGLVRLDKKKPRKAEKLSKRSGGDGALYSCNSKASEYVQEFTNYPRHILEFGNSNSTKRGLHPTQKPTDLLEYLIKTYTHEKETVLDCTMGSGSTGIACLNTHRKFIGFELDEHYFNVAKDRLDNHKTTG